MITKTLTNRLKVVMPYRVGPNQCSFIPGRQIADNVIIYQEVLHSMRQGQRNRKIMLIKVDLEKAYDRLSWDYIRDTLEKVGLPTYWVRNIMKCEETSSMTIAWNGKNLASFKPFRPLYGET